MRKHEPKNIGGVIESLIENLGIGKRLKKAEAMDKWITAVGEQIGKVTVPVRVEGDALVVHVTSASWRNELVFLKRELIVKVNEAVGEEVIKEIIFR